ncbi:MAG: cupin-like domain-containing protein [Bacteriovoracaceae bacterium]|nr:cupin-like domain-containing protein [Bacteriovoracaceae bacterium]
MKLIPYSIWLMAHIFQSETLLKYFYKRPANSESLDNENNFTPIEECDGQSLDTNQFKNLIYKRRPIIIRGIATAGLKDEINHEYLLKYFGDQLEVTRNSDDSSSNPMPIKEILNNEKLKQTIASPVLMSHAKLNQDVNIEEWIPEKTILKAPILNKVLFASKKGFIANLHMEPGRIMNIQLSGKKQWFLVPPVMSPFLQPQLTDTTIHFSNNIRTKADLLENLPKGATVYTAELEKGDALLIPPFHWHVVENHDDSVSVAYQWMTFFRSFIENPLMNLFVLTCRKSPIISLIKKDHSKSES